MKGALFLLFRVARRFQEGNGRALQAEHLDASVRVTAEVNKPSTTKKSCHPEQHDSCWRVTAEMNAATASRREAMKVARGEP